jgi:antitoxin YxxD
MKDFDYFKKYIFAEDDGNASKSKHSFYKLDKSDILEAEQRLGYNFPLELRGFYTEIGYGFLCNEKKEMFDRVMDPGSVADFMLCEGMYEGNAEDEYYDKDFLVFFEVSEVSFIAMDLTKENMTGKCPIYYFDTKIADSLLEFMQKMDEKMDYYLDFEDE